MICEFLAIASCMRTHDSVLTFSKKSEPYNIVILIDSSQLADSISILFILWIFYYSEYTVRICIWTILDIFARLVAD